jgi:predicted metal-binding protein
LQKLESGEIKVEKKAEFKCDFSTSDYGSSFYCIPHHETAESRRLKEETIKAFRENVETREENWQKFLRNAP